MGFVSPGKRRCWSIWCGMKHHASLLYRATYLAGARPGAYSNPVPCCGCPQGRMKISYATLNLLLLLEPNLYFRPDPPSRCAVSCGSALAKNGYSSHIHDTTFVVSVLAMKQQCSKPPSTIGLTTLYACLPLGHRFNLAITASAKP